jgi:hypothetical protein
LSVSKDCNTLGKKSKKFFLHKSFKNCIAPLERKICFENTHLCVTDVAAMHLSEEEQTRRLIEQMSGEAKLEYGSHEWQQEIEARLNRLKGISEEKVRSCNPVSQL